MFLKLKTKSVRCKTIAQTLKLLTLILLLYTLTFTLYTSPVYAATCNPSIPGDCPAGLQQIEDIVRNIISVVVGLGFIAMLVMLIRAGIQYLTSGGEPKAVQQAHFTVTWALLGVIFMAVAWLILQLIRAFTGIDITIFDIRTLCGGTGFPFCK